MVWTWLNSVYRCMYTKIWKCHRKADHLPEPFLGGLYTAWQCMYKWANSCTIALLIPITKAVQAPLGGTVIKCVVLMYNVFTCLYNVCTRLYNVCTCTTYVHVYTLYVHVYTMYVHVPLMYNVCTCLYIVCTCIYNVCTWFHQVSQQVSRRWWISTEVSVLCPYTY